MMKMTHECSYIFDARHIAKRFRLSAILGALETLDDGQSMRLINDYDPILLLQQITLCYPRLCIDYVANEPDRFVIDIMMALREWVFAANEAATAAPLLR